MVKGVLFDLFETLITESQAPMPRASSLGAELGFEPEAFRAEWKARRPAVVLGRLSFREALADIGVTLGRPVGDSELQRVCWERTRAKAALFDRIEPQISTMIRELRTSGARLGVVSNCFAEDVTAWPTCSLAPQFDCAVFSFEAGVAKPDPAIYLEACRRLDVTAVETVFIGDGMHSELMGAEDCGMRAFQALWFLRRWPHFCAERVCARHLTDVEEVLALA
jgi:putative hydrolase of the HAD superfamily